MKPAAPLEEGERILVSFASDRRTYIRDHAWMAVIAMAGGMALLWAIGNPHAWTGAVGGLAAIVVRGAYLASDELAMRWDLTDRRLLGPGGRVLRLTQIETVRGLGSAVQVVTKGGDKHLIKYPADRAGVEARLRTAAGLLEDKMQEPKDPRMSGKIALVALLVIAALTAVMVWTAG